MITQRASMTMTMAFAACLLAVFASPRFAEGKPPSFAALCYHNVTPGQVSMALPDMASITLEELTDQFDWLRENGYSVISVEDVLKAKKGLAALPPKAVLLTFDDGYESFYRMVYPLLRAYNYPALLALETDWLETPPDKPVNYGSTNKLPRSHFLKWSQIKEMADSGLVELAGHSHNLHRGHSSNPQQVPQPAGLTLAYDPARKTYETETAFYNRIKQDVRLNADLITQRTGHRPRVLAWPYGHYAQTGVRAALDAGYLLTASLNASDDWATFGRFLAYSGMNMNEVMNELAAKNPAQTLSVGEATRGYRGKSALRARHPVQRVVHVDLDMVYDPDPAQQNANISALFDRIEAMRITTVYLQAYADPDGDGIADSLYFPNRHLPMRADLFNYVSWQLYSRLDVAVYAWMPVLGFALKGNHQMVTADPAAKTGSTYQRLSPFDPQNKKIVAEIYRDLAMHSHVDGLLFHDDALLGDYEDASPSGRAWLREQGLPDDMRAVHQDPELMRRVSRAKTLALIKYTRELHDAFRTWSQPVKTARNIYAEVVLRPEAEAWFAQNLEEFLAAYDYTAVMAMPFMEKAENPSEWLASLATAVKRHPLGAEKTVFELQAVDWRRNSPVPSNILAEHMRLLLRSGIANIGYYPENPITAHPDRKTIHPFFSAQDNPFLSKPIQK